MPSDGSFRHRQLRISEGEIHVVEAGPHAGPAVLFLHGWPQSWSAFQQVLELAGRSQRAVAIDLPGVGGSHVPNASGRKRDIARIVHGVIQALELSAVTLVGHDCGGQVVFAYLTQYDTALDRAVIVDVVVPGVEPWSEVLRNPYLWHFAFHSIPELPETLVQGKQAPYFDFFYAATAAHPERITPAMRAAHAAAYADPAALHTGFEWYRAFAADAEDAAAFVQGQGTIRTPLLYLRGDRGYAAIETYVQGFRAAGVQNIESDLIADSGHFAAEEQPDRLWQRISAFVSA